MSFWASDLAAAEQWYTTLLGQPPYFVRPGYREFRIGDYQHELGLIDRQYAPTGAPSGPGGAIVYWHTDGDIAAAVERLVELGATVYEPPVERGPGFVTASVVDPFGNILGIMSNPHYREVLASAAPA